MATLLSNAEGGTSGTTVTAANSGGASGNAFNTVSIGTSASLTFSNVHAAHGGLAYRVATTSTSTTVTATWSSSLTGTSVPQVWYRIYVYFTANPSSGTRVLIAQTSTPATCAILQITTSGTLRFTDGAGATVFTSTTTIPLNTWCRIEGFITGNASVGQVSASLYRTADATVPGETNTSAASLNTTGAISQVQWGLTVAVANVGPFWMDDLGVSTVGPLGPVINTGDLPSAVPGPMWLTYFRPQAPRPQILLPGFQQVPAQLTTAAVTAPALVNAAAGTLPAAATTTSALTRQAAQSYAATVTTTSTLTRAASRVFTATAAATAALVRTAAQVLASSATTVASLARSAAAQYATAVTTMASGSFGRLAHITLTGSVTTAGSLIRRAARGFATTVTTTAGGLFRRLSTPPGTITITPAGALTASVQAAPAAAAAITITPAGALNVAAGAVNVPEGRQVRWSPPPPFTVRTDTAEPVQASM